MSELVIGIGDLKGHYERNIEGTFGGSMWIRLLLIVALNSYMENFE